MTDSSTLPVVANAKASNIGMWAFLGIVLVGGIMLFIALSSSRTEATAPNTVATKSDKSRQITAPPPLELPADYLLPQARVIPQPIARLGPPLAPKSSRPVRSIQRPARTVQIQPTSPLPTPDIGPARPSVVFDSTFLPSPSSSLALSTADAAVTEQTRVTANRFARPSLTIPQGTVVPAVLETALDSTRPGAVRALVQLDVRGFDGTRILINRGSRLYGEYEAGLNPGEKRALIRWTRLIRPDGVTIALDSPASDPLGRAGVRGDVDTKFFQRFGGALLQSILDIGVGIATREASGGGLVVALPGSTQQITQIQPQQVTPTLKVKHGTSVSVFVARDLDFSTVEF